MVLPHTPSSAPDNQHNFIQPPTANTATNSFKVDSTNFMQIANVRKGRSTIPADEYLQSKYKFNDSDADYNNPKATHQTLLGWKYVKQIGKGQHSIATLWKYDPTADEKALAWQQTDDYGPIEHMVVKQANGATLTLEGEASNLEHFTKLGCCHFPRLYDGLLETVGKTTAHKLVLEYFPNGSLATYMSEYQQHIPVGEDQRKRWETDCNYGVGKYEHKRLTETALWSLFVCLAKSVLAAETGKEHIAQTSTTTINTVFVPLDLKPDNVLVAADEPDPEHQHFPRVVWADFSLALFVPTDWTQLTEEETLLEVQRLSTTFPHGMKGDQWFMAPEQRDHCPDYTRIGTCTNVWHVGALMWWCIVLCELPPRYSNDEDRPDFPDELTLDETTLHNHTVYSEQLRNLICRCLASDTTLRPNAHELLMETVNNLNTTAQQQLVRTDQNKATPQSELLVPRLKSNYNLTQLYRQHTDAARNLFQHFTGNEFKAADEGKDRRQLLDHTSITDHPDMVLADGLAYSKHCDTRPVVPAALPSQHQQPSAIVSVLTGSITGLQTVVRLKIWTSAVRQYGGNVYGPNEQLYTFQHNSTIADLKIAIRNTQGTPPTKWLQNAIVHIFPPRDERSFGNGVLIGNIPPQLVRFQQPREIQLDCICIKRAAAPVNLPKPKQPEPPFNGTYYDRNPADPIGTTRENERYFAELHHHRRKLVLATSGTLNVPSPFTLRVFAWPRAGRSRNTIVAMKTIPVTVESPPTTTIEHIRQSVLEQLRSRWNITLNDTEYLAIHESGPFNAIHAGADYQLPDALIVSNIVLSREQTPSGSFVIRNLDALIHKLNH